MYRRFGFSLLLLFIGVLLNAQDNTKAVNDMLLKNIWYWESEEPDSSLPPGPYLVKFFDNGNMIIITVDKERKIPQYIDANKKYTIAGNTISFKITGEYEGTLREDNIIYGSESTLFVWGERNVEMNFVQLADPELLNEFSEVLSVDMFSVFPKANETNDGPFPSDVTFENTFDFYVAAVVLSDDYTFYHLMPPNGGTSFCRVNNGEYRIFYIYYDGSSSLYQGNNITVNNQEAKITLKNIAQGNYNIRKVN
ncbi:hypothetical protein [Breznakiella homolactica]|uniref:Lipocalin-like domain-containing protein n=1 Tax=Breznakiella homolactica TaxID=2798577 RepID=A0A7T7XJS3_9SPIR|nr:hypothetical protein [Breznakiella homolactica]QQO07704.1 hypothetical protein JFL75_12195 [Breznakiella homolactica]